MMENDTSHLVEDDILENSTGEIKYKLYKRRWYLLGVLAFLNVSNGLMWISFSPVADYTAEYYSIDAAKVNWLSMTFMVVSIPVGVFSTWFLDGIGIRASIVTASWINIIGSLLRVVSCQGLSHDWSYPVLLTGQTLCAIAQPLILFAPTKVAALWFPASQRALANTLSTIANPVGIMLGNILSPVIVKQTRDIPFMLYMYSIPAGVGMLLATFGICHSLPPSPPTSSAASTPQSFIRGVKQIFCNKSYWILTLAFGMGIAMFTAANSLLEQILCPLGYNDNFAGLCNALMVGIGLLGAAAAAVFADKTKKFVEVAKCGLSLCVVSFVGFLLVARYSNKETWLLLLISLTGFFGFASNPISLELSVECTFPVAEATSAGILILSGQVQSFLCVFLMQTLARPYSVSEVPQQKCHTTGITGMTPQDYTVSDMALYGYAAVIVVVFVVCFRCPYRRMQAEGCRVTGNVINDQSSTAVSSEQLA